ncbi:hypothetical protein HS088_TW06G00385 [Tripterygium wilfordii]|uniref:Uncharacterized protein n=1 Tax=Tripterygium wilfordii TaxID=458696 RepID=A0A7J7DIU6_TRIWF|nr:hypothetical protein HS088_TW06G00385 [Tripterygium wilfordii]
MTSCAYRMIAFLNGFSGSEKTEEANGSKRRKNSNGDIRCDQTPIANSKFRRSQYSIHTSEGDMHIRKPGFPTTEQN